MKVQAMTPVISDVIRIDSLTSAMISRRRVYNKSAGTSTNNKKQQKCQPAVRGTLVTGTHPTLLGGSAPDGGLARPKQKNKLNVKNKMKDRTEHYQITIKPKNSAAGGHPDDKWIKDDPTTTKQQKCQPAVRDTPVIGTHPILLGGSIPDGGLARPIKITLKPKTTATVSHPDDKWIMDDSTKIKQQKCQPAVRDTLVTGTHPILLGGSIPDGGLARPIKITLKPKTTATVSHPDDKWIMDDSTKNKTTKVSACCQGYTSNRDPPNTLGWEYP